MEPDTGEDSDPVVAGMIKVLSPYLDSSSVAAHMGSARLPWSRLGAYKEEAGAVFDVPSAGFLVLDSGCIVRVGTQ